MNVCPQCAQENPEIAKFCLACGSPLAAPEPLAEERKLITVLFCDIVGSTAAAEKLDPEDVRARLAPYYARLRRELERYGGTVEKFIGDAVVALFGAPVAHEDDPERAVRAALAICEAINDLNAADEWLDLKVRIGVNTGEALVVVGARSSEGEGMASGDVMNTTARLQSAAPINGVLAGEETYLATREAIDYSEAEPIAAKGKAEPVRVWEVVGVREREQSRTPLTPLIGRDTELDRLLARWNETLLEQRPSLFGVVGTPGIGKSRLLAEFADRIRQGGSVHWGRCLSYGEGITYWPVTELVKSAAGILQSDVRETVARKLDLFLEGLPTNDADELRTVAAALSNVIGIPMTPRGTYEAGEIAQGELHWGIRRAAQLLALDRPTVLVFEDLHWAEPTLIELLEHIVGERTHAPLLIIWTARPEFLHAQREFAVRAGERRIELEVLPAEAGTQLLGELIGDSSLAETQLAEALIENAGGNPLFLEETVRMLKDQGMLQATRWHEAGALEKLPVPTNLQGLISSRLDSLAHGDKQLAHDASVVGAVFWAGAVAHLGATDGMVVRDPQQGLQTLARQDFIRPNPTSSVVGEHEYAFKHILIRDVAYGQVPKGRRVVLHVRFSDWVTIMPSASDEFVEIVAWHLEQACRLSREVARSPIDPPFLAAAGALANAAGRAERREGLREAFRYYTRALDVLGDEYPERQLELRLRRSDIMMMLGELKEACDELVEVAELASSTGNAQVECEALLLLGDIDQRQGRAAEAHRRLAAAKTLAEQAGIPYLRIKVAFVLGALLADFDGRYDGAIEGLRSAIAISKEVDERPLTTEGHLRLAAIFINRGELAAAEEELRRCLELASELGSHRVEAEATSWLGMVVYQRGEIAEGERLCLQARQWLERTGDTYFQVQNLVRGLAIFALDQDQPERAEEWLREAVPIALQIGGWVVVETYRYLVEALIDQGRLDDAQELLAFAARGLPEQDPYARSSLLLAEAIVATAAGESISAATAFSEALRLIEELDMPMELGDARMALGRSLRAFGDVQGARTELMRARATFARIGASTRLDTLDGELADLTAHTAEVQPPSD
jgi:class 3 adenylate cyclase/tetratricopeptide (TPR) repeat protein